MTRQGFNLALLQAGHEAVTTLTAAGFELRVIPTQDYGEYITLARDAVWDWTYFLYAGYDLAQDRFTWQANRGFYTSPPFDSLMAAFTHAELSQWKRTTVPTVGTA